MRYKKGDKVVLKQSDEYDLAIQARLQELNNVVTISFDYADPDSDSFSCVNEEYKIEELRGYHCFHDDIEGLYVESERINSRLEILDL